MAFLSKTIFGQIHELAGRCKLASRRHGVISMYSRLVLQHPRRFCSAMACTCHETTHMHPLHCYLPLLASQAVCHCQHRRLYATEGTQALSIAGCLPLPAPQGVCYGRHTGCQHHRPSIHNGIRNITQTQQLAPG